MENQLYFVSVANNRSLRKNKADFLICVMMANHVVEFYKCKLKTWGTFFSDSDC